MTYEITVIEGISSVLFLITLVFSIKNFNKTKNVSSYWLVYSIAALLGFFWATSIFIEWLGFFTAIIDDAQQTIIASSTTAFVITTFLIDFFYVAYKKNKVQ
ncbi:hypothetical protein HYV79_05155 [Candidatus Woesearchaeota archaeon]|nr:hypothetical protein [Candidatus Woesearchaeota archaeon]